MDNGTYLYSIVDVSPYFHSIIERELLELEGREKQRVPHIQRHLA